MTQKLKQLAQLADMAKDKELAKLSALMTVQKELQTKRDALVLQRRNAVQTASLDASSMSGNSLRWDDWAQEKLNAQSAELSAALAKIEMQKQPSRRAFGRATVLARLVAESNAETRRNS